MSTVDSQKQNVGICAAPIVRYSRFGQVEDLDLLAVEEPLRLTAETVDGRTVNLGVAMRTPGDDAELVTGMLFSEGIISSVDDIVGMEFEADRCRSRSAKSLRVFLGPGAVVDQVRVARKSIQSSACGLCGRETIDHVLASIPATSADVVVSPSVLLGLHDAIDSEQPGFARTGGLHAAALFSGDGSFVGLFEDIGRHNAVDKLLGWMLRQRRSTIDKILFLSGRAGFELLQKAAVARIPVVASVGAPSSLAVACAVRGSMTLVGFLRDGGFNVYSGESRLDYANTIHKKRPPNVSSRVRVS
jgi:FdhD protein